MSKFLTFCILFLFPLAGFSQSASFSTHNAYTLNSSSIRAIGDLNNDGYQDLVISTQVALATPPTFSVLLSKGDGTYRAPITYTFPTGSNPAQAVLADLNGDGKLDLVHRNLFFQLLYLSWKWGRNVSRAGRPYCQRTNRRARSRRRERRQQDRSARGDHHRPAPQTTLMFSFRRATAPSVLARLPITFWITRMGEGPSSSTSSPATSTAMERPT